MPGVPAHMHLHSNWYVLLRAAVQTWCCGFVVEPLQLTLFMNTDGAQLIDQSRLHDGPVCEGELLMLAHLAAG